MSLPVAILAGGLATRLGPATHTIPKSLVDVAGRPFVEHQLELLRAHGLTDILFLLGHRGDAIRDHLGDGTRWGVRLRCLFDGPRALGTGGAIRAALPHLGDSFFVLYGDSYLECDYQAVERAFAASGKAGLMTVHQNLDRWDKSNVEFDDGRIFAYDKELQTPRMRYIDYGLGVLSRAACGGFGVNGEPFDLATLYQDLLARQELAGFAVPTRFFEIGSPAGLAETRARLARKAGRAP